MQGVPALRQHGGSGRFAAMPHPPLGVEGGDARRREDVLQRLQRAPFVQPCRAQAGPQWRNHPQPRPPGNTKPATAAEDSCVLAPSAAASALAEPAAVQAAAVALAAAALAAVALAAAALAAAALAAAALAATALAAPLPAAARAPALPAAFSTSSVSAAAAELPPRNSI